LRTWSQLAAFDRRGAPDGLRDQPLSGTAERTLPIPTDPLRQSEGSVTPPCQEGALAHQRLIAHHAPTTTGELANPHCAPPAERDSGCPGTFWFSHSIHVFLSGHSVSRLLNHPPVHAFRNSDPIRFPDSHHVRLDSFANDLTKQRTHECIHICVKVANAFGEKTHSL
jgi:hypothetical protein